MAKSARKGGRRKGSRNRGYWFRAGRGWYVGQERLCDADGNHIRDRDAKQAVEQAYHALKAVRPTRQAPTTCDYTVRDVCILYLQEAQRKSSAATYRMRRRFLEDFCEGKEGIHKGYGNLPIDRLIGLHVKQWLDAHDWNGSRRMAYQALRRAIRFGITLGVVRENPIKGFPAEPARKRRAYFSREVEQAMYDNANRAFADVLRAMIRTGCRPGEVARLERRHMEERDGRMIWRFPPAEHKTGSKTKRDRVVPVCTEVAEIVRERLKRQDGKHIFLNARKLPWTATGLKSSFARLRKKLAKKGIKLGPDQTLYACRHTYAKRQLGKGISTNVLAAQMGNSPQIAWDHYGRDWDAQADNSAVLWSGIE